ncbi:hypothetical protein CBR_g49720 [Chara braunii]|uniref:Integrase catalytic domain-containing protein n=1 Tax=Chara braunii TaxID=69332 RepID=A0A388M5X2_CHABU|nr:hypothetical protein CBR_g49720 [Chara braunii]|eukprot:GBG89872.1 hypothetical protein CBR_g49720 [Chara braunii]
MVATSRVGVAGLRGRSSRVGGTTDGCRPAPSICGGVGPAGDPPRAVLPIHSATPSPALRQRAAAPVAKTSTSPREEIGRQAWESCCQQMRRATADNITNRVIRTTPGGRVVKNLQIPIARRKQKMRKTWRFDPLLRLVDEGVDADVNRRPRHVVVVDRRKRASTSEWISECTLRSTTCLKAIRPMTIYPDNLADTSARGGVQMSGDTQRQPSVAGESAVGGDVGDDNDEDGGSTRESGFSAVNTDDADKRKNMRQQTFDAIVEVMEKHSALMAVLGGHCRGGKQVAVKCQYPRRRKARRSEGRKEGRKEERRDETPRANDEDNESLNLSKKRTREEEELEAKSKLWVDEKKFWGSGPGRMIADAVHDCADYYCAIVNGDAGTTAPHGVIMPPPDVPRVRIEDHAKQEPALRRARQTENVAMHVIHGWIFRSSSRFDGFARADSYVAVDYPTDLAKAVWQSAEWSRVVPPSVIYHALALKMDISLWYVGAYVEDRPEDDDMAAHQESTVMHLASWSHVALRVRQWSDGGKMSHSRLSRVADAFRLLLASCMWVMRMGSDDRFILRTDSTAVIGVVKRHRQVDATVSRWIAHIWTYDFVLEKVPTEKNRADGLSRLEWGSIDDESLEEKPFVDEFLMEDDNEGLPPALSCYTASAITSSREDCWGEKEDPYLHYLLTREDEEEGWYRMVEQAAIATHELAESSRMVERRLNEIEEEPEDPEQDKDAEERFRKDEYDGENKRIGMIIRSNQLDEFYHEKTKRTFKLRRGHFFVDAKEGLPPLRVVCGKGRQLEVIAALHEGLAGGHRGVDATYYKVSRLYHWDGLRNIVMRYCKSCEACQKRSSMRLIEPVYPTVLVEPGSTVHLDLITMPSGKDGMKYVLNMRDNMSGYVEAKAIRKKTAKTVVDWIEEIYLRYSFIRKFVADQGSEFKNEMVRRLMFRLGVRIRFVTPCHPQANAPVERGQMILKDAISKWCQGDSRN